MDTSLALPINDKKKTASDNISAWVCPEFKVSGVFSSHMVLQREKPIHVWGFSDTPGSRVAGCFMGETVTAEVNNENRWKLTFSSRLYTCEPQLMVISDDRGHTVTFEDILIGDVWMIGGQSNAEMTMAPCMALTPSVEFSQDDNFRLFTQTQSYVYTHQEFCEAPQPDIINADWCWKRPDREASLAFSAMGWHFAKEVSHHIDVPLGMVMMAAGGACIRELIPEELAHGEGYFYGANVREAGYYNTLIHPFEGLQFKAMLFFQGESEGGDLALAQKYDYELALLVTDERTRFGFNFPFYNVQLSDYREEGTQFFPYHDVIRIKQFDALSIIPDSTLTVDMDLGAPEGHPDWAHSPRKWELGERLAKLALAKQYSIGRINEAGSPCPVTATLSADRKQITVEFMDVGAGLIVSGHSPADSYGMEVQGFSVGDYENRVPTHAALASRCAVVIDVPEGADPSRVNYAYSLRILPDTADLRGGNNLPCPAFSLKVMGA